MYFELFRDFGFHLFLLFFLLIIKQQQQINTAVVKAGAGPRQKQAK